VSNTKVDIDFDERRIDAIFSALDQCQLPGAVVGIAIRGKPVYRKGFGLASLELPLTLAPSMRLRIGSTSKHFTCFAYMLLCEEGKAGINDPVSKYFPELHKVTRNVTMRQLMANVSGLRDAYDLVCQFDDHYTGPAGAAQRLLSEDVLHLYQAIDDVNAPPGSSWIYNNGGWLLLSLAIERLTGHSLERVLWERVFQPIGMYDSLLLRHDSGFVANRASQHVTSPGNVALRWWEVPSQESNGVRAAATTPDSFERMSWGLDNFLGAGAVVSTVDDLLRWLANMGNPRVGSSKTWALMKEPHILPNGTSTGYGLGLMIDRYRGYETLHHAGNSFGGNADILKIPEAELDVVVVVNRQDVSASTFMYEILNTCLSGGSTRVRKVSAAPVPTGVFVSPNTGRVVELVERKGCLYVSVGGTELQAECDESGREWRMEFAWKAPKQSVGLIGDVRRPTGIRFNDFGNIDEMVRAQGCAPELDVGMMLGRYRYEALGIDANIFQRDEKLWMGVAGGFSLVEFSLEPIAEGIWRARSAGASRVAFIGGILTFGHGGFTFANFQTRPVSFRRIA